MKNPFISLLAGVAGAAVYDHLKGKGSMAKHKSRLQYIDDSPAPSPAKFMEDNTLLMVLPLLEQLEYEQEKAAMSGDEESYYVASLEIENVKNLMNQLMEGLASATPDELKAIRQYKGRLGMIKKELDYLAG